MYEIRISSDWNSSLFHCSDHDIFEIIESCQKALTKRYVQSETASPTKTEVREFNRNLCKRGGKEVDEQHLYVDGVCAYCADGARPPPPGAYEQPRTENRIETVQCSEHGAHVLNVKPDGTYDKPDCDMFRKP